MLILFLMLLIIIFQAAGEELNKECSQYIQQHGNVNTSQVVVTNSYLLKKNQIKYILHAVGPIYYTSQDPENELFNCVQNILKISFNNLKLNTVAIPAISSGVYGFPKGMCAQIFKLAIEQYIQEETNNQGTIILCNFDQDNIRIQKVSYIYYIFKKQMQDNLQIKQ